MALKAKLIMLILLACCRAALALEPEEILVLVNRNMSASSAVGRYYCEKRNVPYENILYLHLVRDLRDNISRKNYEKLVVEPVRFELLRKRLPGSIRCLLTTYGVPIRILRRPPLKDQQAELKRLKDAIKREKDRAGRLERDNAASAPDALKKSKQAAARLQLKIDRINGKQTDAALDSELSMVLYDAYELHRWQPNKLRHDVLGLDFQTLMVSRLDASDDEIIRGLVDKAVRAEKTGLKGNAYFDSRGIEYDPTNLFGYFDQSLRDLAKLTKLRTSMTVKEQRTQELFAPDSCPQTALYCGWYSLKKYVDAFDFVDGAVGYHIASFEAAGLHDPNSANWCPAMLRDGITATLGPVTEPYLHSFPEPRAFFERLYKGDTLVEAYYRTKPFNSWQLILIGDPLYTPFPKP